MVKHNAKFIRAAVRGFAAFAALGCFQVASAAYADMTPPTGYKNLPGGAATYAAQKTDIPSALERILTKAEGPKIMLGRTEVRLAASLRYSPAASKVAAAALYLHPGLRTAVTLAGWLTTAKVIWDAADQSWKEYGAPPSAVQWHNGAGGALGGPFSTAQQAGDALAEYFGRPGTASCTKVNETTYSCHFGSDNIGSRIIHSTPTGQSVCPEDWTPSSSGCISPPLSKDQFVDKVGRVPMPSRVPLELPFPTDLPIDKSSIKVNPTTSGNPDSQSHREASGDPVPIPNTQPVQYRKPYIDIVPSPTSENPWRVDIRPGESTSTDPKPVDDPHKPLDTEDKPTEESDKSLCEKHPEILACAKVELDVPDGEIPKATKELTYTPEAFGGGSCPADLYSSVGGQTIKVYDWAQTCGVVTTYLRPIIILLGAMGALFILIPGRD